VRADLGVLVDSSRQCFSPHNSLNRWRFYCSGAWPLRPLGAVAEAEPGLWLDLSSMALRALLYRRPSEPSSIQVVFDRAVYLVRLRRHRQARRYTLRIDAASRDVVLTMPPRGAVKEARDFAQK